MNILFDENTPRPLKRHLPAHFVKTTQEMGWAQVENGELLDHAEAAGFHVLLTTDRNIPYQQKMTGRNLALIILQGKNNRVETLSPLIPQVEAILLTLQEGHVYVVSQQTSPLESDNP